MLEPTAPVDLSNVVLDMDGVRVASRPMAVSTKLRLLLIERAQFNGPGLFDDPLDALLP